MRNLYFTFEYSFSPNLNTANAHKKYIGFMLNSLKTLFKTCEISCIQLPTNNYF